MTNARVTIPNFRNWRAVVLHRPSPTTDAVLRQLERLGIQARALWPELDAESAEADVIFFDADMGFDEQFPWPPGEAPVPLVALVGSEAPGRLEWVLARGAGAHLMKPVSSGGVYSALVIAGHALRQRGALAGEVRSLRDRLRRRPQVASAVLRVMTAQRIESAEAMQRIRRAAMEHGQSIEDYCDALLAAPEAEAARAGLKPGKP
ncbi:ANTAR domain-containing protein [Azospirillum sp. SYSU D00513]|uniref:ANTAR domain-containing response regulator n=1 Tax=Azospirillum sp. SYSU D00513 TaxID=2812561 RepID=UPI001A96DB94|nr:ANTAR domain-containing protein [Azospirillum sp. SYSU D00513]